METSRLRHASLRRLEEAVGRLSEPRSFFRGASPRPVDLPVNIVLFQRDSAAKLGQDHHYHYRYVLVVALQSAGSVALDGKSLSLEPGQAILVFPHQFHHLRPRSYGPLRWLFITFELAHPGKLEALRGCTARVPEGAWDVLHALVACFDEVHRGKDKAVSLSLLTGLLLHELARHSLRAAAAAPPAQPSVVDKVCGYVWDNFHKEIQLSDLTALFPYSESHLRLLFRKRVGMSIGAYIQRVKMNRARSLLMQGVMNISEVAQACGFDSLHSFSRAFRRSTGLSPRDYRKVNSTAY